MLNFEETQTQTINVEVSDEKNKNSTVVHIVVLPVNEYDPEFKPDSIVWNVTENSKSSGLCVNVSWSFVLELTQSVYYPKKT